MPEPKIITFKLSDTGQAALTHFVQGIRDDLDSKYTAMDSSRDVAINVKRHLQTNSLEKLKMDCIDPASGPYGLNMPYFNRDLKNYKASVAQTEAILNLSDAAIYLLAANDVGKISEDRAGMAADGIRDILTALNGFSPPKLPYADAVKMELERVKNSLSVQGVVAQRTSNFRE